MKRTLCLWFPDWPIQRRIAKRPELRDSPLLLKELIRGKEIVQHASLRAQAIGISPQMPVADAQSLVTVSEALAETKDPLVIEPVEPEQDRGALEKLAVACEHFSPSVGLEEADRPECLLLDITGLAHLFAGEAPLTNLVTEQFFRWKLTVRAAVGDSVGSAWAAAHFLARERQPAVLPVGNYEALHPAPVACLRISPKPLQSLSKLGVNTIGRLLKLDRHSLPARFGRELNQRVEQFLGRRDELITPHRPPPDYRFARSLEHGLTHPKAFESLFESLLQKLITELRSRSQGVSHLECEIECDDRRRFELAIRLCELTIQTKHIGELFRLHLERITLTAPVVGMTLKAVVTAPLKWEQLNVFANDDAIARKKRTTLLNRLSNRLGENAVTRPRLTPDSIPELSYCRSPIARRELFPETHQHALRLYDRPLTFYHEPVALEITSYNSQGLPETLRAEHSHWSVARLWGPERIESGWWRGPSVRRDYYRAELADGRRYWLFQRINDRRWFLHGAF